MNKDKFLITGIAEMAASADLVPYSSKVDKEKLVEGDDDPMFVTLEVLNPSVSANKRRWTPELLNDVAQQINDKVPDGYMGHLDEKDRATKNPEAVTMWVGASVKMLDGTPRLFAKGYIFPYATKLRQYLKKALAASKKIAVSVYGEALQMWNKDDKVYDIKDFVLESIDWARYGSEGVTPAFIPVIAKEQKEGATMNREEIIKSLTLDELKTLRPDLIEEIQKEVKPVEPPKPAPNEPPAPPAPAPEPPKEVHEMRSLLGIEEGKDVIGEMKSREDERLKLLDVYIDSKVAESVGRVELRGVFRKMVVGEMKANTMQGIDIAVSTVLESEEGKTLLAEMTKEVKVNDPIDNRTSKDVRKFTKLQ